MQTKRKFLYFISNLLYIGWTLLLGAILTIIINKNYKYAQNIALHEAKTSVNKDLAYRTWVASHGGVYVPVTKRTPPNPYLANIKDRDFSVNGRKYTLMNPAYTLSQMMKDYTKLYGVKTHITSRKLLNPKNRPDAWETCALENVEATRKQYYELNKIEGKEYLRLMNPLVTKKSCLKCHAFQGYNIGDIRGGVSVSIPMAPLYKSAFSNSLLVSGLFFLIWLLGIFGIRLFKKKISNYIDEKELMYEQYIYGLVNVVEKRDTYTAGHSQRVADYAVMVAKEMGLSEDDCNTLHRAGMLHDIGKIAIPDSVFLKPTKLLKNEYALIQEHVVISYDMLKDIAVFDDIKEIVRDHHEHYDGSGYPRGLIGDETPLLAQILALADSFDAMTTDRIYKGRKSVKEALEEISSLSSKQFNPKIVRAALVALKDVQIDTTYHQNPQTLLEKERFSYFYKDALTSLYNEYYLRSEIHNIKAYKYAVWISLKNFHYYNKVYGWHVGDELLVNIASMLKSYFKENGRVYRFFGDNFFISCRKNFEHEKLKEMLDELLTDTKIHYEIRFSTIAEADLIEKERLEDVLKKLF
jgi:putative nucleotidyltransferase with HDIG domain